MKYLLNSTLAFLLLIPATVSAVTQAEDIATTIKLRGYECGGRTVSNINEREDGSGGRVITATCPNGKRYRVEISAAGRVSVSPLN